MCNLQCNGFGQDNPTDPKSWDLPYETIDISDITDVMDLPVFSKGCDSSYTWARRYSHLIQDRTVPETVDELEAIIPGGKFKHHLTGEPYHMVFTGGEPMLKVNQRAMVSIMQEFAERGNMPEFVTVETNGTQPLTDELAEFISKYQEQGGEWYWSLSPKLWSTAGEPKDRAIIPEVVGSYARVSKTGQLKFVVNGSDDSWVELEEAVREFRAAGCDYPVWVMGVGGTVEGLKLKEADIADQTIQRGYRYTSRIHTHIYGNVVGK